MLQSDNKHAQLASDIIIDEQTIRFLKSMFCDREAYIKHMTILKTMLSLLHSNLLEMDHASEQYKNQYPLFDTLNNLVGSIQCPIKESLLGV